MVALHAHGAGSLSDLVPLAVTAAAFLVGLDFMARERASAAAGPGSADVRRRLTVGLLYVASMAHIPVVPEHLQEAPYMGVLFIVFALSAYALAVALTHRSSAVLTLAAGVLCASAVCAYVATRVVAFPQLADDVGNWAEPLGLVAIAAESAVVVLVALSMRRPLTPARQDP